MTVDADAVTAYPGPVDAERLDDCRDLRRLQVLASMLVQGVDGGELYDDLVARLGRRLS